MLVSQSRYTRSPVAPSRNTTAASSAPGNPRHQGGLSGSAILYRVASASTSTSPITGGDSSRSSSGRTVGCHASGRSRAGRSGPIATIGSATIPVTSPSRYSSTARSRCHTGLRSRYCSCARVIASTNDDIADDPDHIEITNPIETTSARAVVRMSLTWGR